MLRELINKLPGGPPSFPVDDVTPGLVPIPTEALNNHLAKRFRRKVLLLPEAEKLVANTALYPPPPSAPAALGQAAEQGIAEFTKTLVSRCHPLIDTVGTAFAHHRPLILSPDSIWLAIEQGFAHHILENAKALRHRLVRHQGSRELVTAIPGSDLSGFEFGISDLSAQIRAASDPVLHETLICNFSTTTHAIRTASEIVLMDCYSSYFTYMMVCVCGIPRVTLQGSPEDWQRIRARVEVLGTYDLEWWVARLRPILDEFIRTAEGNPDVNFWRAIYKPHKVYFAESVTGWISDFFPYLGDPPARRRNHVFGHDREDWAAPYEAGVATKSFPSGLSSVPVKVSFSNGPDMGIDLVAGFLAVDQNPDDLALSPLLGWSVTDRAPAKPVMIMPSFGG